MKSSFEKIEENKVRLTVEVPAGDLEQEIEKAYKKIAQDINVPGFRKGKIPKNVIDARVGKDAVVQEAIRDAMPNFYAMALTENEIEPIDVPSVDIKQGEQDKDLIFTADVVIKPVPKLGKYKDVEVEQLKVEVDEDEVTKNLDRMREQFAVLEDIEEDRAVRDGDHVIIDFKGFLEGEEEPFDGGSMEDYTLLIGSKSLIDTFEDQLIGKNKTDDVEVKVTFPEGYNAAHLAGKPARFEVKIKEIKEKVLPEMNDELAQKVSTYESAAELEENLRKELDLMYKEQAETDMKARLLQVVTEAAQVSVPDVMVEDELDRQIADFGRMMQGQGIDLAKYYEVTNKTEQLLRDEFKDEAQKTIKVRLVLEEIAKVEDIKVDAEDIEQKISQYAAQAQMTDDLMRENILRSGAMALIEEEIRRFKAINWIAENAKVVEVEELTRKEEPEIQGPSAEDRGPENLEQETEDSEQIAEQGPETEPEPEPESEKEKEEEDTQEYPEATVIENEQ